MYEAMVRLARDILAQPDWSKGAAMAVARIGMNLGVDCCSLYALDHTTDSFRLIAHEGPFSDQIHQLALPENTGLVGFIAQRAEPLNLLDASSHPAFVKNSVIAESEFNVFLGVPMVHNRKCVGVLTVRRDSQKFTDDEEGFLTSLATALASTIAHAIEFGEIAATPNYHRHRVQKKFRAIPSSPGYRIGTGFVLYDDLMLDDVPERETEEPEAEFQRFLVALKAVRDHNETISQSFDELDPLHQEIFNAYLHILDDETMVEEVKSEIFEQEQWAPGAVKRVFARHIVTLEEIEDFYLAERGDMLRDIADQLLEKLQNIQSRDRNNPPANAILIAEYVTATMIAEVVPENIIGIVSKTGSANSHTAILARALGIPAVMGAMDLPLFEAEESPIALDGSSGEIYINPTAETLDQYKARIQESESFDRELEALRDLPAETTDGHRVQIQVNIGMLEEIQQALDNGAEGVGLFRTEVPFASKKHFPTEAQQREIYRQHMLSFEPKPVTMRILDIGGDKELPYFRIREDNPYLGLRGIRVTLDHPDIFLVQVRAMLKASDDLQSELRILLPMISNLEEVCFAKNLVDQAFHEIKEEGFNIRHPKVGAMVEVPALVFQIRAIAEQVDFLAVGSNDLTQYLLAVSRNDARVVDLYREFHPSVLIALNSIVRDAHRADTPISICGEMAGTIEGAVLLLAMGFDSLSMNATHIPRVKWLIRNLSYKSSQHLLAEVLAMDDATEIVEFVRDHLQEVGLGKLLAST
ncbi:MAG: phosphoenolpyruvate--protein phosphotransferase [Gammaproteobacteria bacterium]|nr:phosphoenolpyruvate--protein phosphotransferase [Gammaproteobacteria bacterium]